MRHLYCVWVGCLFVLAGQAVLGATSEYVFITGQSTITQTGGFAGVHWTYTVDGRFRLAVEPDAGIASFTLVDANAAGDSRTLDPNGVFNMTGLTGTVVSDTSIRFTGKVDDGSSVLLTVTFDDDLAYLTGGTTPPPSSADFFVFSLNAVAQRKYAAGVGEPNDPYQITTAADLIVLGETPDDYDKCFILTADIDLDPNLPGGRVFDKAVIAPITLVSDPNSVSIVGTSFVGAFDGDNHAVLHLTIDGDSCLGLFGCLESGAEVWNLGVTGANITAGGASAGALVGSNFGAVTACYSTGVVNGTENVGGLVGWNYSGSLFACCSASAVGGTKAVGGLAGKNGTQYRKDRPSGSVTQSFSAGIVRGTGWGAGGLIGASDGAVAQCYSTAAVSGGIVVGGLVGCNYKSVTQCYSVGAVTGNENVGGLTGMLGKAEGCLWDAQTSGQTMSVGGEGKTTAQMQMVQTYLDAGWDFLGELTDGVEDIWWILEGRDYPHLWWEKVLGDDFEDGEAGPRWMVFEVDPDLVQIKEVNGRLEVSASAAAQNVDAFYVSQDWRLDVTQDFAIRVDYHFTEKGGGDGRVTIGLLPSIEMPVTQWAEFEVGCFDSGPFYLYELRDDGWVREETSKRSADEGTLYVSYNPAMDELYFSHTGYGKPNAWRTVTGLLKGRWAGEPVYVILGGGSEGLAFDGADAWLDNFAVQAGAILE